MKMPNTPHGLGRHLEKCWRPGWRGDVPNRRRHHGDRDGGPPNGLFRQQLERNLFSKALCAAQLALTTYSALELPGRAKTLTVGNWWLHRLHRCEKAQRFPVQLRSAIVFGGGNAGNLIRQRRAFLDMLAWSEGTDRQGQPTRNDGYDVIVRWGALLRLQRTTPGSWSVLPKLGVKSTAAGRYQLLAKWWMHTASSLV
ncbi:phage lysozyme [Klebsiella pneumoniae]|uniref:Phage lysozyme n=1 Tax=Klebsiella pneumoniae TaxID=573 RepID=A0A377XE63_KLEPN|nr:phage lysozyme [Klebsiella pneumoniae]